MAVPPASRFCLPYLVTPACRRPLKDYTMRANHSMALEPFIRLPFVFS
jgi:hypothetical protein